MRPKRMNKRDGKGPHGRGRRNRPNNGKCRRNPNKKAK